MLDIANDRYIYTKHVSLEYVYTGSTTNTLKKKNILVPSSYLFPLPPEHVHACAITKTRLGDATWTMVTVAPLQVPRSEKEGAEEKEVMPDLGWRSRGQRFFPVCRSEKTHVFLRYTIIVCIHHPSTFSQIGRD